MNNLKRIALVGMLAAAALAPALTPLAHADVPTPAQLSDYAATSTNLGSDYITGIIFSGGMLKFLLVIAGLAVVIWFVKGGFHKLVG